MPYKHRKTLSTIALKKKAILKVKLPRPKIKKLTLSAQDGTSCSSYQDPSSPCWQNSPANPDNWLTLHSD